MREILFKAKRIDNGEWVEGYLFFIVDTPYIICDGEIMCADGENADLYAKEWYEVEEKTICQYTGLTDKNGNMIWENDVVKIEEHDLLVNGLYKVCYCETSHCYTLERSIVFYRNFFKFSDLNGFETTSEVIGNIFDNPELLKGSEENG